ncbi:peptide chain release factor N(5)-glutamine methyltransferase [Patiriisocius marinus]|uniref:peptide chain release factor N(5)-glutamine methyltransferase n=1 Tax=Patiriisocius marinus TaxID=1397112 RepID=UPI00232DD448|nr:peptide chain release factor N(5)-glutamine methyltransferase [Patiriisocius marinus]
MTFKDQRLAFAEILKEDYPPEEINSFFYILTEHYFHLNRFETHQKDDAIFPKEKEHQFSEILKRLKEQEPIQYIIGETEFFGLPFKVTKDTLIPRPETEELVELVITEFRESTTSLKLLDIGTGSGCIAISLAKNLSNAIVSAIDISEEALKIAKENAQLNNVSVEFIKSDILQTSRLEESYDIIVSNPPYVRDLEKKLMQPNVLDFEPEGALFVRDDNPLIFYRSIAILAKNSLKPNGLLVFEINEYLALEMTQMLTDLGFTFILTKKDIFGKDRIIQCNFK